MPERMDTGESVLADGDRYVTFNELGCGEWEMLIQVQEV